MTSDGRRGGLVHVYGVVRHPADLRVDEAGLGPVRDVSRGDLAALCSDVETEPLGRRRELKAHADVLAQVCQQAVVIPMTFGTVLADDDAVRRELLERFAEHLGGELDRLATVLQFNLRLVPDEDALLRDVLAESADLRRLSRAVQGLPTGQGHDERLRLGEAMAHGFRDVAHRLGDVAVRALAAEAVDLRVEEAGGPEGVTRAALLVQRSDTASFLDAAGAVAERLSGRVVCRLVGPLPPFAFVAAPEAAMASGAAG
jgi:hypothetical protein